MNYDESTNPTNGWRVPDELEESDHLEPGDLSDSLADLEPNDGNPLEREPLQYNPLNHAYPMMADTDIGVVELMVQFTVVRGKRNLPDEMACRAAELQVPVYIEDVPVSASQEFDEAITDHIARDIVSEGALIDELSYDQCYYLTPMIVRARRFTEEGEWETLTKEETAGIIPGEVLLNLIKGYADKVAADPNAPTGLLDLLDHFTGRRNRAAAMRGEPEGDEEDYSEEWN